VHFQEDLADHCLLVGGEIGANSLFGDVPVVIDLGPKRMVEGEGDAFPLRFGETLIESGYEGFGSRAGWRREGRSLARTGSAPEPAAASPVRVVLRKLRRLISVWEQQSQRGKEGFGLMSNINTDC